MPAFSNKAMFIAPKSSQFNPPHNFTGTIRPGKLIPVAAFEGIPSEVHQARISHLERFFPMLAPIMDRYDITFDCHFVPYRLVTTFKAEKFFNDSVKDSDKTGENAIPKALYTDILGYMVNHHNKNATPIPSSLYDYLKFPFDSFVYKNIPAYFNTGEYDAEMFPNWGSALVQKGNLSFNDLMDVKTFGMAYFKNATYRERRNLNNVPISVIPTYYCRPGFDNSSDDQFENWLPTMWNYAVNYYNEHYADGDFMSAYASWPEALLALYQENKINLVGAEGVEITINNIYDYLDLNQLAMYFGFASLDTLVDQYQSFLYTIICIAYENKRWHDVGDGACTPPVSLLPMLCYKRIYADRYVNTNFFDVDEYLLDAAYNKYEGAYSSGDYSVVTSTTLSRNALLCEMFHIFTNFKTCPRWWKNDAFTSATVSSQVDSDVLIPVSGTIRDLRRASKIQSIRERAMYAGKRFIDNIFVKFGVKSDDLRSLYSVKLGRAVSTIEVSDVMSTAGTELKELGSYAGAAINADSNHAFKYTVSEYGMFMIFASVMPKLSYLDSVPKHIFKTDYYDFLSPEFASIGEQPILKNEVAFKLGNGSDVLGFNRRYYDYQIGTDNICGRLRLDMDYWNSARDLSDGFVLDQSFLVPDEEDRLNRIFANSAEGVDNIALAVCVQTEVIRPLPRFINYHL